MSSFEKLGINQSIIKALNLMGYEQPTKVQSEVIPVFKEGQDILVKSQTGSGKTAAFGIPLVDMVEWEERAPQGLVLAPTRELALQIQAEIFNLGRFKRMKVEAVFGRSSFEQQEKMLKQRTHIVVATPGRLLDHVKRGTIDLSKIKYLVIDEADEMLDMGFVEQIEAVIKALPNKHQTALFSATMPDRIKELVDRYLTVPKMIEVSSANQVQKRIEQVYYNVLEDDKLQLLLDVIVVENPDTSIIFCNTRDAVEEVVDALEQLGAKPEMLHGGMEQRDRTKTINEFKQGYFRYLVATDVAARGLDVTDVTLVVNFDLPDKVENYTHRIGRTARFENSGRALVFVNQFDERRFSAIRESYSDIQQFMAPKEELVISQMSSFSAKQNRQPELKALKELVFKDEIMKLHINAGKKTKMRAGDVVGAICNIDGLSGDDIGVISLLDVSTFVEILNGKGDKVLKELQSMPIKGRMRRVNKANESQYEKEMTNRNK
ncbi:DEAD/DEAH box helicase [Vagococcus coleopterorum]|uniref:DEAD/DEAH box helicase n=1 Tax=Vagococcus coleopterorum TaxID=2714946 RepID=A0A6G8AMD6_9ENTE|nr:DEAD/DEAH box helicase [Vagococcus coleopterorum]QIL46241.1 DEAD/DEAH box helicase [Vagococcus coleopterorum]